MEDVICAPKFRPAERIIYDSGFGYEIGYFVEYVANHVIVDLISGSVMGDCCFSESDIHHYTEEKFAEVVKKYKYEKSFNDEK